MCTTKTPKTQKVTTATLGNEYLDGGTAATGITIGRKQLRTASPASTVQLPSAASSVSMPTVGLGARK